MRSMHYEKLEGFERWIAFSMYPRTEEEIERELLNNPDDVCMSFICAYSNLSEEFIEKLKILTACCRYGNMITSVTINNNYDKVKKVMDYLYSMSIKDREDMNKYVVVYMPKILTPCNGKAQTEKNKIQLLNKEEYLLTKIEVKDINDRLDWKSIGEKQKLSLEFIKKHKEYLDIKDLKANSNISKEDKNALEIMFNINKE